MKKIQANPLVCEKFPWDHHFFQGSITFSRNLIRTGWKVSMRHENLHWWDAFLIGNCSPATAKVFEIHYLKALASFWIVVGWWLWRRWNWKLHWNSVLYAEKDLNISYSHYWKLGFSAAWRLKIWLGFFSPIISLKILWEKLSKRAEFSSCCQKCWPLLAAGVRPKAQR